MKYKIMAIVGEAGSGKDFVLRTILKKKTKYFNEIIHTTTRPPREGEINGKSYYFKKISDFKEIQENAPAQMLTIAEYRGWFYGIDKTTLDESKINIGVLNLQEIEALKNNPDVQLCIIYLNVNAKKRLIRQLTREENPDVGEIIRRFSADNNEFFKADKSYWNIFPNENWIHLLAIYKYAHRMGRLWAL